MHMRLQVAPSDFVPDDAHVPDLGWCCGRLAGTHLLGSLLLYKGSHGMGWAFITLVPNYNTHSNTTAATGCFNKSLRTTLHSLTCIASNARIVPSSTAKSRSGVVHM